MKSDSIRSGGDVIQERSDYKNWMPKGMVHGTLAGTLVCLVLFIIFGCTALFTPHRQDRRETAGLFLCPKSKNEVMPVRVSG